MSKETISQTEGLCKEVATCVRNAYDRGYKQGYKDGNDDGYDSGLRGYNLQETTMLDKSNFSREQYNLDLQASYDCGYQRGLNDAWECARKIWSMSAYERAEIFHDKNCMLEHTASKAIQMIKEYEEKQTDKILVGDEVRFCDEVGIVTRDCSDGYYRILRKNGDVCALTEMMIKEKTGRHFDQIEEIMKKIGVDDE